MKKKIFSILGILILGLNTVFCQAVEISFSNLDSQNENFYIDEEYTQESFQDSQNFSDSQNLENENILEEDEKYSYEFEEINEEIIQEDFYDEDSLNFPLEATGVQPEQDVVLEHAVSTININRINLPTVTNYMVFSRTNNTFIDVTDLATGEAISHDCQKYLNRNFDETEHWNECTICGNKFDITEHAFSSYWLSGDTCHPDNKLRHTCNCGYFYESANTRSHASSTAWCNPYQCAFACSVCHTQTAYYGTVHYNSSNQPLGCVSGRSGTCKNCKKTYTSKHYLIYNPVAFTKEECPDFDAFEFRLQPNCLACGFELVDLENTYLEYTMKENIFTFTAHISYFITVSSVTSPYFDNTAHGKMLSSSATKNGQTATFTASGIINEGFENVIIPIRFNINDFTVSSALKIKPDVEPPVITEVSEKDIDSNNGWVTAKELTIRGTENYCKSIKLSMTDEERNVYLNDVSVNVNSDKTWEYTFTPEIESDEGTNFIITAEDNCYNKTVKDDVSYSKLDRKAPIITTETDTTSQEWSKTKEYTASCLDKGVGEVSIAFNSMENNYLADKEDNNFYKNFTFTGDVYGKTIGAIYYQDGLGNTSTSFVDIYNLDNTAPSIEDIVMNKSLHNTEVVISANDINEKLNASGSGVTGYAISTKNEIPDTFQEDNTFNLTEAGTYYIFVTDLVGNITSKEIYIPVQYKVTIDPDGGTWKGNTTPKEYITDESINLYPEPEKEGYTFKEWSVNGDGEITEDGELIVNGDVTVIPIWEANKYEVTFIDYDVTHNRAMNTTARNIDFNSEISGSYIGSDTTDNAYYPQYRLVSDTEIIISTNPENNIVYRYFEFCYTSKKSHINFNDNDNADGLRPETYKLQLVLEDGKLIDEVELSTSQPDYTFENLPKYDEQGEEYNYKIIPIISDRYTPTEPDEDGNTTIIYTEPNCNFFIPKVTTLDGRNGDLNYTIQVDANLFYKDKIIIVPDTSVILTDGVKNLNATITQNKTEFNKEDDLTITGTIQTTKKHFAGTWTGTFNFKIKYEVSN